VVQQQVLQVILLFIQPILVLVLIMAWYNNTSKQHAHYAQQVIIATPLRVTQVMIVKIGN
jgi:hypothetical protein